MIDIYGTIGPACCRKDRLLSMFEAGMTGMRVNLSHMSLEEAEPQIRLIREAAGQLGITPKILIDMQGPELRIGKLAAPLILEEEEPVRFENADSEVSCHKGEPLDSRKKKRIPVSGKILAALTEGTEILLDDGKLLLQVTGSPSENQAEAIVLRGGSLQSRKSIALAQKTISLPAMTDQDRKNILRAPECGVTGVMQPFVRSAEDLKEVRQALDAAGGEQVRLFAKIENLSGVDNLETFFGIADEIVIARGDLGNAMPLWHLPAVQKQIENSCKRAGVPYMVVTQMLSSMEHSKVPTRAEVSDIFHAAAHGAASVMVTGETAVGAYPVEVIRYLANTAGEGEKYRNGERGK